MLIKAMLLGAAVVSTPLYIASAQGPGGQDPVRDGIAPAAAQPATLTAHESPAASQTTTPIRALEERHARELERLKAKCHKAVARAVQAETRAEELHTQLEECMEFVLAAPVQRSSCKPSRSRGRTLMTHYQWMRHHGHDKQADRALTRIVEQYGRDVGDMNRLAWHLMTDKTTSGKYDDVALALAEQMAKKRSKLNHRYLDTIALAKFLNGNVDEAISYQRKAIDKGGNSDDYRRRLRTYEAAKRAVASKDAPAQTKSKAGKVAVKVSEDE